MGRKQQQRRAKKKAESTVDDAALKCTACRQIVAPDTSIACPVPECDRIFCTKRCSTSCILRCADPDCPEPNRCRPCATGKTRDILSRQRKNEPQKELDFIHDGFFTCENSSCRNLVCGQCFYVVSCDQCDKHLCVPCGNVQMIHHCVSCDDHFCVDCDDAFNVNIQRCTKCAAKGDDDSVSTESIRSYEDSETPTALMDQKETDGAFLEFAEALSECLGVIMAVALRTKSDERASAADSLVMLAVIPKLLKGRLPQKDSAGTESLLGQIARVRDPFFQLNEAYEQGELEGSHCIRQHSIVLHKTLMSVLLPNVTRIFASYGQIRRRLSCGQSIRELERIYLDRMQTIYGANLCGYCLHQVSDGSAAKRCGECKAIYYCDEECQSLSWPSHREHCCCMKGARDGYNKRALEKKAAKANEAPV